uniref:Uncharacterized protein n=1 Tax=Buteo japonicus TaxID=224669 RepID=A0A8B9ZAP4_9AVES
ASHVSPQPPTHTMVVSSQATASCHSNKTLCFVFQVRPKLPLLKILQAAGAQGETFTLKEVGSLSSPRKNWNRSVKY